MDIKRLLCLYLKSSDAILLKTLSLYFVFTITPNQNKFYFVETTKVKFSALLSEAVKFPGRVVSSLPNIMIALIAVL